MLVNNIKASKVFKDDPVFNFMRICDEKNIPSLELLKKFTSHNSLVLIDLQIS